MHEINRLEKDSILYYQGGGEDIILNSERQNLREFYNIKNSYIVINTLLMPGISNEKARLIKEKKEVNSSMLKYMDELLEVYCRIYSAICKYTYLYEHEDKYYTYRDDRMNTLEFLKNNQMYSFMSTKKCNDKNKVFHEDKDGILLLEVEAPGSIEHIDVNAILKAESKYPDEQEVLFAPFALLDMYPLEMTEEEKRYKDYHGNPPAAKYLLHVRLSLIAPYKGERDEELKELYQEIIDPRSTDMVRQVWETFMSGKEPEEDVVRCYTEWKKKFQIYLRLRFARIKYEVLVHSSKEDGDSGINDNQDTNKFEKRLSKLNDDIINYYNYTDERRKKYKNYVQIVNVGLSILYPLTTFLLALSFQEYFQVYIKFAALVTSTLGAIVTFVVKGLAWNEKLQQRTNTYLKLDKLKREMKYEKLLNENGLDVYVERYNEIIDVDNEMGGRNVLIMGAQFENIIKNQQKKQEIENG